jgi:DNA-binding CsgD family transcriptional regulator/sugar-specific transcriptional regulator TrmB
LPHSDPSRSAGFGRLTPDAVELYTFAIANPSWTPAEAGVDLHMDCGRLMAAVDLLRSLRLLRPSVHPSQEWDAVSPDTALAELLRDDEERLRQLQTEISDMREEISSLNPRYFEARRARYPQEAIDVVYDVGAVRLLLGGWSRQVERVVRIAHPGSGLDDSALARSLKLDLPVLRRGVCVRILLQHSTRNHQPTRHYVTTVAPAGAQVRTVPIVPRQLIVFDNRIAFIPLEGGCPERGAVLVKEPAIIDYMIEIFELSWTTSRAFPGDHSYRVDDSQKDLWKAILDHLSTGAKDDMIARRLGLSVRTCRRHIAAIMDMLGANSRFQAGVLMQQQGMLNSHPLPIEAPADRSATARQAM